MRYSSPLTIDAWSPKEGKETPKDPLSNTSPTADKEFGWGAPFEWPGDEAEGLEVLQFSFGSNSSEECLYGADFIPSEDDELTEEEEIERGYRQERFEKAREWDLNYLVASATYHVLDTATRRAEKVSLAYSDPSVRGISAHVWAIPQKN